jgi:protein-S-isoprenylcysteine O-methyltransferase Ste14
MPYPTLWSESNTLWLVFAMYFTARYRAVRVKRDGGFNYFSMERVALFLGIGLLFFRGTHLSSLGTSLHLNKSVSLAGLCLVIVGLAFSAWARDVLGRNWSGRVIIQDNHQLVTAGPYAYVRHPLYTGILIAMTGTMLIAGDVGAVLGFLSAVAFFMLKAQREEKILEAEFGAVYTNYRARTGGLLPRLAHV